MRRTLHFAGIERYTHARNAITAKTPQKGQPNSRSAEKYTTLFETDCTTVAFFALLQAGKLLTLRPSVSLLRFCNFFSVSHVKRTTLAKHENDCSAVGKSETTFVQTVSLLLPHGKTLRTAFRAIISASHVERTTLAKHENDCSAVGKCETTFVQTVSLLLLTGKQYAQRFVQSFQQATLNVQRLQNMKTIVPQLKSAKRILYKLLSHCFSRQTLHFNFTDTLTPSPVRYSCVR